MKIRISIAAFFYISTAFYTSVIATPKLKETELEQENKSLISFKTLGKNEKKDDFHWQNEKHFQEINKIFVNLAERELNFIIDSTIIKIKENAAFFKKQHERMINELREIIFDHIEDCFIGSNSSESSPSICSQNEHSLSENSENEDNYSIGKAYTQSYERDNESEDKDSSNEKEESAFNLEDDSENFKKWKYQEIKRVFRLSLDEEQEFEAKSINIDCIQYFLNNHCEEGWSWFINEIVEGSLSVSEIFTEKFYKKIKSPKKILEKMLTNLWFDYDWEQFNIADSDYISKTYIETLSSLKEGKQAKNVKNHLLKSLKESFTFNKKDFNASFYNIRRSYNHCVKNQDWLGALIEWSIYSTYRKVFENPGKKSAIRSYQNITPALPIVRVFNQEKYLKNQLEKAYERAHQFYTKVYPHLDTKRIIYRKNDQNLYAILDLDKKLSELKGVGLHLESVKEYRPRGKENIFVPNLYFIVSNKNNKHKRESNHTFFKVPLEFPNFPKNPLTRSAKDMIFLENNIPDNDPKSPYFRKVRNDIIKGATIQGQNVEKVKNDLELKIAKKGRNQLFVHSERVWMEFLRSNENINQICEQFSSTLLKDKGDGLYKIHGSVILAYSTNTVCNYCTPTLIALQNSHQKGEFLDLITKRLITYNKNNLSFKIRGYDSNNKTIDWSKFSLNTFVTASVDFDSEARDLADQGQHSYKGRSEPPKETHNPHAKLFFPNNEINLYTSNNIFNSKDFFYEFVGKEIHKLTKAANPYFNKSEKLILNEVTFSSGSKK